jgi:hypothetical protein
LGKNKKQIHCYNVFVTCKNYQLFLTQVKTHMKQEYNRCFEVHHRSRNNDEDLQGLRDNDVIEIGIDIDLRDKSHHIFESILTACNAHQIKDHPLYIQGHKKAFTNWVEKYVPEAIAVFLGTLLNNINQNYSKIADYFAGKNNIPHSDIILIILTSLIPSVLVIITIWGTDAYYKKYHKNN